MGNHSEEAMFIIELLDDYGPSHYGPFADKTVAENWVKESLKAKSGSVESDCVFIWGHRGASMRRMIGKVIKLKTTYEPGIIRDGH